ncbi:DsbA family protein [Streptomyces sp. NPDC059524]|uniref:DsbA family protein n=1 Tax=Streptomyces sp. NPDC059524 TaxID=3346856 RepID=UPI00367475CD
MVPAQTTGSGGTTLYYGDTGDAHRLQVFLELRDRASAHLAASLLDTFRDGADAGDFVLEFHFAAVMDDTVGGSGSRRALAALGAAADVGAGPFMDYLGALFAAQPFPPGDDGFGVPAHLLSVAGTVAGLRSADFDAKVAQDVYNTWAAEVTGAFASFGLVGTPAVRYDDTVIPVVNVDGTAVMTPREFAEQLASA